MLLNFFGRHGEIEEGSVAYDKDTNESRYGTIHLLKLYWEENSLISLSSGPPLRIIIIVFFMCSGFGFVTYKTVESAKKAIDDPQKTLGVSFFEDLELCNVCCSFLGDQPLERKEYDLSA